MTREVALALQKLAQGREHRSKIGRLRSVFLEVQEAQAAGVSNRKIVDELNEQGFGLTLKTFETMLYRIRHHIGRRPQVLMPETERGSFKISNPVEVRKSRARKIDLDDYKD